MHSQRRVALPACTSVNGTVTEAWADSLECASLTAYNLQGVKSLSCSLSNTYIHIADYTSTTNTNNSTALGGVTGCHHKQRQQEIVSKVNSANQNQQTVKTRKGKHNRHCVETTVDGLEQHTCFHKEGRLISHYRRSRCHHTTVICQPQISEDIRTKNKIRGIK